MRGGGGGGGKCFGNLVCEVQKNFANCFADFYYFCEKISSPFASYLRDSVGSLELVEIRVSNT